MQTCVLSGFTSSLLQNVIMIGGQIMGTYKRTLDGNSVTIETHMLAPSAESKNRALASAVRRYSKFVGSAIIWRRA